MLDRAAHRREVGGLAAAMRGGGGASECTVRDRLFGLRHASRLEQIEVAARAIGRSLEVKVAQSGVQEKRGLIERDGPAWPSSRGCRAMWRCPRAGQSVFTLQTAARAGRGAARRSAGGRVLAPRGHLPPRGRQDDRSFITPSCAGARRRPVIQAIDRWCNAACTS
jgi:hypothetical protein